MVQRQTETLKQQRDRVFRMAIAECPTPEAAAVRLGVSVSTVMRFKRKLKGRGK